MGDELWHPDGSGGASHAFWGRPDRTDDEAPTVGGGRRGLTERERRLPEHEFDDERTLGGGILGEGGTAIEKGSDTIDDEAPIEGSGEDVNEEEAPWNPT